MSTESCIVYMGAGAGVTVILLISGMATGYLIGCIVLGLGVSVAQLLSYGISLLRARLRERQADLAWDRTIISRKADSDF